MNQMEKVYMIRLFTTTIILLVSSSLFAQVQMISGLGEEYISAVETGPMDNIYVLGTFEENLFLSGEEVNGKGGQDVFLAKYDPDLKLEWLKSWGGPMDELAGNLSISASGQILATINFNGPWLIGDRKLQSIGAQNIATLEIQPDGKVVYATQLPGEGKFSSSAIAINNHGERFYAFTYEGIVQISGVRFAAPMGQPEVLLLKKNANHEWAWAKPMTGVAADHPIHLVSDPSGGVYLACTFTDVFDNGENEIVANGNSDFYLAHYTDDGLMNWYDRSRGAGFDEVRDMTADQLGNIYLTGDFTQQIQIGGLEAASAAGKDLFVAKWNAAGDVEWLRVGSGGMGPDAGNAITYAEDRIWVTGKYAEGITFGKFSLEGSENTELFIASYAQNGLMDQLIRAGGTGLDHGKAIQLLPDDEVLVAGTFEGITNLGGIPIESSDERDAFLWIFEQ